MTDSIFVPAEGGYRRLTHVPLALEDDLQRLLNSNPELIALDRGDQQAPLRLLLVRHEAPVKDRASETDRWSLDHLFIDDMLVPTLVESKLSRNAEVRRKVVGQLLEYAAQAWVSWTADDLLRWLGLTYERTPDEVVAEFLGEPRSARDVAEDVERNLRAGRLRLMFVADGVPDELQAIVEFLNANTTADLEVLALELRTYGEQEVLVPRIIGNTASAKAAKRRPAGQSYDQALEDADDSVRSLDNRLRQTWGSTGRGVEAKGKSLRLLSRDGVPVLYFHPDGSGAWFNESAQHPSDVVERYRLAVSRVTGKLVKPDAKMLWIPHEVLRDRFDEAVALITSYTEDVEHARSEPASPE